MFFNLIGDDVDVYNDGEKGQNFCTKLHSETSHSNHTMAIKYMSMELQTRTVHSTWRDGRYNQVAFGTLRVSLFSFVFKNIDQCVWLL